MPQRKDYLHQDVAGQIIGAAMEVRCPTGGRADPRMQKMQNVIGAHHRDGLAVLAASSPHASGGC